MRRLLLLLLVPLCALPACGTSADNAASVHRAVATTRAAHTAAVDVTVHADGLGSGSLDLTATGTIDLAGHRTALTVSGSGTRVETRLIGTTLYVHRNDTWFSADTKDAAATGILPLGHLDPAMALDAAAAVRKGRVQRFGHDHFRARTDEGTLDVWLDGQGRIQRVVRPLAIPDQPDVDVTITVALRDFGRPVTIDAPPDARPLVGDG